MSKYRKGNYDTGEPRYIYLKIWKHMPERCPRLALIRRKMWLAQSYKDRDYDYINNCWR